MSDRPRFDPHSQGIYRRFLVDEDGVRRLHSQLWNGAVGSGEFVGTCPACGAYLVADPTHQTGRITWYSAHCTNPACRHEFTAPNGLVLRRSSRHGEMPQGAWDARQRGLQKAGD